MKNIIIKLILLIIIIFTPYLQGQSLAVEQKIDSLLLKMTLDEKIGQLVQSVGIKENTIEDIRSGKIGSILGIKSADEVSKFQKIAIEESRLKIPLIFANDVIHGFSTTFPIPLAEASSWNPELVKKSASIAAYEAASEGTKWNYAPMVDISRDPRWGRIMEGSGEDPYLGSVMAIARIEGFQGDDFSHPSKVVATAKHFVAYGAAEAGRDYNSVDISERRLREIYLPPFLSAVNSEVGSIMSAFNDINGIPASANKFILTEILRDEWKFKGTVITDYNSVGELVYHGFAKDKKEAALKGLTAGIDIDMVGDTIDGDVYSPHLKELLEDNLIDISSIDKAVRNVLRMKFNAGLFEKPYVDSTYFVENNISQDAKNKIALQMAKESIVLLKNDNNLLPLNKKTKKIAVIGSMAENEYDQLGAWTCKPNYKNGISALEGIRELAKEGTEVLFARGFDPRSNDKSGFEEALSVISQANVAVVFAGENWELSGEAASRTDINLPGVQLEFIKRAQELETPIIVVLMNGRPLTINWSSQNIPAILEAWYLGDMSGKAIASVLFGEYNPSGKLPITFPRSVGQIPIYYNAKSTGRPAREDVKWSSKYLDSPNTPLYPFGFGLSYTQFKYSNFSVNTSSNSISDSIIVTVDVTNIGKYAGEEVVQLYIQDLFASVTRPIKELKSFKKIKIDVGKTETIKFIVTPSMLSFYGIDMKKIIEPGEFKIFVGGNSTDLLSESIILN
ncbi:MAG: glycoside hydrolase family 3 C-terminal domain-containing protein [Melioribacteraceae bacterium]|nr:glycoside hydrolase family 3 C-terminal domain-containing protein [Melioribacteraceae bacterium]